MHRLAPLFIHEANRLERGIIKEVEIGVTKMVKSFTDDEIREIARSGKLSTFMQSVLFNVILHREKERSGFHRFMIKCRIMRV